MLESKESNTYFCVWSKHKVVLSKTLIGDNIVQSSLKHVRVENEDNLDSLHINYSHDLQDEWPPTKGMSGTVQIE